MLKLHDGLQLSASDLVNRLNCRHLTALDLSVANGVLPRPRVWDPVLAILAERGSAHERNYVDHLRCAGHQVVEVPGKGIDSAAVRKTLDAMRAGIEIITQGALLSGAWSGRVDVLRRVVSPSALGGWSYEVIDTKLARETRGGTILQLCLYTDLLAIAQGYTPARMHVVAPWSNFEPQTFRMSAYAAYFRKIKGGLERALAESAVELTYPDPKEHCNVCRWRMQCDRRRRDDDHLSLVAGITKVQIAELNRHDIPTTLALAKMPMPLAWKPERGGVASYERVREQARLQVETRRAGKPKFEVLPVTAGSGLSRLPAPSPGDVFLDIEGDPFLGESGQEFLFGYLLAGDGSTGNYHGEWALTREEERRAFEQFVDLVMHRWSSHPDLHIYHYSPYEPGALKRLMGRYATREEQIDRMLRGGLFVDLYQVVRQGVRVGVESYSIKELESVFGFERRVPLADASKNMLALQACLELPEAGAPTQEMKDAVAGYNRDDCAANRALRDWLERIRSHLIEAGQVIERPSVADPEPTQARSEWQERVDELVGHLTRDVPADPRERSPEQQARWLMAHLLDWHRREDKAAWWEFFRLSELSAEDLQQERAGLSGLEYVGSVGGTPRAPVHRYRFPLQDSEVREEEQLHLSGGEKLGKVQAISYETRLIDIKKRTDTAAIHPDAVFTHKVIDTGVLAESLLRIGRYIADQGLVGAGRYQAARDLLLREPPRLGGALNQLPGETTFDAALRIATLVRGVLAIQGPPGAGKTHTGARMICALVKGGAKVGITANSHKVIRKLLEEVVIAAEEASLDVRCIQKAAEPEADQTQIRFAKDNEDVFRALRSGTCQVAAGTPWLWARAEAHDCVDVLFVDEAAQMSLANVLAVSQAAEAVVLLGDPQQLDQPTQGSHPDGVSVSALDHVLGGHKTITAERGLFLEKTWRLHPRICEFTSELFYEGRLLPLAGLETQQVRSHGRVQGVGLRYIAVPHEGNQSSSPEEAQVIQDLVADILGSSTTWIDRKGREHPIQLADILIIAPYNAQVSELQGRIRGARVGTVDKFQGQEAPIVIYSMTTSTHADAPRGMNFLYSLKRLNVAISRARCISILVSSPALLEAECRTPEQMEMANAFCRYLELATLIEAKPSGA
jgi:predicted RecB family nuclease